MSSRAVNAGCLILVMLLSRVAMGQEPTPSDRIEALVMGDRYVVEVKRNDVKQRYEGDLLKVTDEWLVLRQHREERHEAGVPIASKLPYAKRLFTNVGIGRWNEHLWIPRAAATVQGRTHSSKQARMEGPISDRPPLQMMCAVECADPQKCSPGTLTALTDRELTLVITRVEASRVSVPYLGDLPLIGEAFSKTREVTNRIESHVALDTVLCIRFREQREAASTPKSVD